MPENEPAETTPAQTEDAAEEAHLPLPEDIAPTREEPEVAVEPVQTPAPQDAELPPETGSQMAQETESVAEAAIAAADARAEEEAAERAQMLAQQAAQEELAEALSPFMTVQAFSAPSIRAAISALPPSDDPMITQARADIVAEIEAILQDADDAERSSSAPAPVSGDAAEATEQVAAPAETDTETAAEPFDPALYINRIEQLF
ncbi:hypothetical protein [Paracoccus albus]|uniref:hypothetical protein n=1 Tax=Paracoccus albus TaxID=3017784 RepID=UPI0022EFF953|nr:hypothetical protein [Paracoccus albus]WBU59366.1 hypothetical protein PAF20_11370 [Paracoccus albus]